MKNFYKTQDVNELREYFGEKIALYFAWLHEYLRWLVLPGIIGLILYIIIEVTGDRDDTSSSMSASEVCILIFTLFIAVMSTFFDQLWIRKEKFFAWEWGMFNIETKEGQRPEFVGQLQKDPVSGKIKKVDPRANNARRRTAFLSWSIIAFFVVLVIAMVLSIFLYRATLNDEWGIRFCAFLNAI